uniref:Transcriptional regulator n=1 Tax=Strongyloides papillosus TaxID=174720 RepID=A0A0N5C9S8_STREA
MFELTDTQHVIMSLILHLIGINFGIWCWYLFPKNPHRQINRCANRVEVKLNNNLESRNLITLNPLSKEAINNRYQG